MPSLQQQWACGYEPSLGPGLLVQPREQVWENNTERQMCSHLFYFSTALKHGTSPPHSQRLVLHNQYTSPSTSVPLKLTNIKK